MKRLFYLFLVATVAFVGCTNDEDLGVGFSGEAVSFSVMELTRGVETKDEWEDGDTFAIFEKNSEISKCYEIVDANELVLTIVDNADPFYVTTGSENNEYIAFHPYVARWSVTDYENAISTNFNSVDYISSGSYDKSTTFNFSHTQTLLTFTFLAGLEFSDGFDTLTATLTIGSDVKVFKFSDLDGAMSYTFSTLVNPIAEADFASTEKSLVVVGYDDYGVIHPCYMDLGTTTPSSWNAGNIYNYDNLAVGTFDIFYKSGTDTYEIYTAVGLKAFANLANGGGGGDGARYAGFPGFSATPNTDINGKLMDDIDLSSVCYKVDGTTTNDKNWNPIGNNSTGYTYTYTGTFDGNGKEVKNLYINDGSNNQGLFGCVMNANIHDLGVVDGSVKSTGNNVGAIVGWASSSTISGCYNTGDVESSDKDNVGGIVGYTYSSTVTSCYSCGAVSGAYYVGGVVGQAATSSEVISSYNTGDVESSNGNVGGIVGYAVSSSSVSGCYNTGDVESIGKDNVGGVVGWASSASITSCYSCGEVSGSSSVGGVVGLDSSSTISSCYYDTTVAGSIGTITGVEGLDTTAMTTGTLYSNLSSALSNTWVADTGINNGYPILTWQINGN